MPVVIQLSVPVGVQLSVPVPLGVQLSVPVPVGVQLSVPVPVGVQLSVQVYFSCLCQSTSAVCTGLLQLSVPVPVGFQLSVPVRLRVFTAGRMEFMLQRVHSSQPPGQFTSVHSRVAVSVHLGQVNEKEGSHS